MVTVAGLVLWVLIDGAVFALAVVASAYATSGT